MTQPSKDLDSERIMPRYRQATLTIDPLEIALAQRQARQQKARDDVAAGHTPDAEPAELRGIPCIAEGVSGVIPGTHPEHGTIDREHRCYTPAMR